MVGKHYFIHGRFTNKLQLECPAGGVLTYIPSWSILIVLPPFWLKLEFSPSASNFARVYFMSQSANPAEGRAYFIQAGENGSADALRLYSSENGKPLYSPQEERALFQQILQPQGSKSFTTKVGLLPVTQTMITTAAMKMHLASQTAVCYPNLLLWCRVYFYHKQEGQICVRQPRVVGLVADTCSLLHPECFDQRRKSHWGDFDEPVSAISALNSNNYVLATSLTPTQLISTVVKTGHAILCQWLSNEDTLLLRVSAISDPSGNTLSNYELKLTFTRSPRRRVGFIWNPSWSIRKSQWLHREFTMPRLGPSASTACELPITSTDKWSPLMTDNRFCWANSALTPLIRLSWQKPTMWILMQKSFNKPRPLSTMIKEVCSLSQAKGVLLDSFTYSDKMHTLDVTSKTPKGEPWKAVLVPFLNNANNWFLATLLHHTPVRAMPMLWVQILWLLPF